MKIYVSDKDTKYHIEYGVDGYEAIVVTEREPIEILSLEQHEAEVRKQTKPEVINELLNWAKENNYDNLKQKLNEMKGE